jgi:hypothetical protein
MRPVDYQLVAKRVAEAIESNPTGSLRSIARVANVAPETVRRARLRMAQGEAPSSEPTVPDKPQVTATTTTRKPGWINDAALNSVAGADDLAAWFDATSACHGWMRYVQAVPLSRVYELADEARKRSGAWAQFADALERRARGRAN